MYVNCYRKLDSTLLKCVEETIFTLSRNHRKAFCDAGQLRADEILCHHNARRQHNIARFHPKYTTNLDKVGVLTLLILLILNVDV